MWVVFVGAYLAVYFFELVCILFRLSGGGRGRESLFSHYGPSLIPLVCNFFGPSVGVAWR